MKTDKRGKYNLIIVVAMIYLYPVFFRICCIHKPIFDILYFVYYLHVCARTVVCIL